jgi:hypothetical protein
VREWGIEVNKNKKREGGKSYKRGIWWPWDAVSADADVLFVFCSNSSLYGTEQRERKEMRYFGETR